MELQQRKYSCGPAAVRAALYVLGHKVTEAALRKWAGTTSEGTDERGILRAVHHYDHVGKEYQSESGKRSWDWLRDSIARGKPVLLCVDQWDHWVAVVGRLGTRVLLFDPDSTGRRRKKYSGLELYTESELRARWGYHDNNGRKGIYYGISVS